MEVLSAPQLSPARPSAEIVVDDHGTRIAAGAAEVRAGDEGVVIGAGNTQIRVDDQGVTIPGLGRIAAPQGMNAAGAEAANLIVCSGVDRVVRNNVVLDGGALPAISASGSCEVVCNNCTIRSNVVAIAASGSSEITLNGGTVTGRIAAIAASGSTEITTHAARIRGAVTRSGNAVVHSN